MFPKAKALGTLNGAEMLPRAHRLRGRQAVERVYQKGRREFGQHLSVRMIPNRDGTPRVAVVVSTAVTKKATLRNRAKRTLRAILRSLRLPGADLVVTVRRLPQEENWSVSFRKDLIRWFPEQR